MAVGQVILALIGSRHMIDKLQWIACRSLCRRAVVNLKETDKSHFRQSSNRKHQNGIHSFIRRYYGPWQFGYRMIRSRLGDFIHALACSFGGHRYNVASSTFPLMTYHSIVMYDMRRLDTFLLTLILMLRYFWTCNPTFHIPPTLVQSLTINSPRCHTNWNNGNSNICPYHYISSRVFELLQVHAKCRCHEG